MKSEVLTIQWHEGKAPIYSLDFSLKSNILATGGQDMKVLLWKLTDTGIQHVATLDEHVATVNCVRWDPSGELLASATDGGENYGGQLLIWQLVNDVWRVVTRCQAPRDIYDLSWSPDGKQIVVAGTDTKVRIFDTTSGSLVEEYSPHTQYIQGVAWDPQDQLICSQSMDKTLAVHTKSPRQTRKLKECGGDGGDTRSNSGTANTATSNPSPANPSPSEPSTNPPDPSQADSATPRLTFLDEKASSYFRRLRFTPDGNLLIAPTASFGTTKCTAIFTRQGLAKGSPSAILPLTSHPSIAVACSPMRYQHAGDRLVDYDYACIYAVATQYMVLVYSTQKNEPICVVGDLHPTAFTDLSWTNDGRALMLSSMEGFCSILRFEEGDLPKVEGLLRSRAEAVFPAKQVQQPLVNMLVARKKK